VKFLYALKLKLILLIKSKVNSDQLNRTVKISEGSLLLKCITEIQSENNSNITDLK
jgi:hypothetical protein